jgi:phosphoglycolate phosphatase
MFVVIKTCIFDMDGTLFNTLEDIANAGNHALACLGYAGHPADSYMAFIGDGIDNIIRQALPEQGRTDENVEAALPLMVEHYDQHITACTRPYGGVHDMLRRLRDKGIALCVVTNKGDQQARHLVETFFPDIRFLAVRGEREGSNNKPDPTDALECARLSGASPAECAFIGDSSGDVHTGRNAGMVCLCVDWGYRSRAYLEALGPDAIASTPEELFGIIVNYLKHAVNP